MVKTPIFKGACTAIVTPFTQEGVDYERLKKNIDFQYENGTAAIVVCGTTGEAATQTQCEQNETVRQAINFTQGRMKVIVGVGSNNTQTALRNAENAKYAGADGILMVTPYYNKSTQKGLIEHFSYVADRVDIPMILYNVPSRTG
ncbi:MAG: dihydrodipicolinate synthase family protein, partial [Candidatus Limivicinus sp.]|nr:dihydrodipicolinate synthase family protein [Candidatus Limivicinus sp.]